MEKGTLLEILRKEVGPWWFGRIKKEDVSLVQEILDPELGWFPKEFVRVIHSPETDNFFLQHLAEMQEREKRQQEQLQQQQMEDDSHDEQHEEDHDEQHHDFLNTSSSVPCSPLNMSIEDACNTTVIDRHNVTTIVIEPSSSATTTTANLSTSEATKDDSSLNHTLVLATTGCQNILSSSQSLNIVMGSADILRKSAVKELLDTEVNYVKLLQSICEG